MRYNCLDSSNMLLTQLYPVYVEKKSIEQQKKDQDFDPALLTHVPTPILVLNPDKSIRFINPAFEKLTGYTLEEVEEMNPPFPWWTEQAIDDWKSLEDESAWCRKRVEKLKSKDGTTFWLEVTNTPIRRNGRTAYLLSTGVDITAHKKFEEELGARAENLQKMKDALQVILETREDDKRMLEERIAENIKTLIMPTIDRLARSPDLDAIDYNYIQTLKSNLLEIVSPFGKTLCEEFKELTPAEIEVANLVKEGKSSKEISSLLNMSLSTVSFHRNNIRKKLGIHNSKGNLRSHLLAVASGRGASA